MCDDTSSKVHVPGLNADPNHQNPAPATQSRLGGMCNPARIRRIRHLECAQCIHGRVVLDAYLRLRAALLALRGGGLPLLSDASTPSGSLYPIDTVISRDHGAPLMVLDCASSPCKGHVTPVHTCQLSFWIRCITVWVNCAYVGKSMARRCDCSSRPRGSGGDAPRALCTRRGGGGTSSVRV